MVNVESFWLEPLNCRYVFILCCLASSLQGSLCSVQVNIGLNYACVYLVFLWFEMKKKLKYYRLLFF